jgi:hypothetical protein
VGDDYKFFQTTMIFGEDNIRPLRYFSSNFRVLLPKVKVPLLEDSKQEAFNQFIVKNGFILNDPRNSLGRIPVANLVSDLDRDELIHRLSKSGVIRRVFL